MPLSRFISRNGQSHDLGRYYRPVLHEEDKVADEALMPYEDFIALQRSLHSARRLLYGAGALLGLCSIYITVSLWPSLEASHTDGRSLSPVPYIHKQSVVFERDDRYAAPSSAESDAAWTSLMPQGDGFIVVNNSAKYDLQPGQQTEEGELYDISLFHQLHCLTQIRNYLWTLLGSVDNNNTKLVHDAVLAPQDDHIFHCFDYIRQGIMCAGDMTVEWPKEEPDGSRFAVNGWGITHQCKSWDAISEYMDRHHAGSSAGHLGGGAS